VPSRQRGRPPKFGRPAQLVALTLPQDVLHGLRRIHSDLGWAIVSLYERAGRTVPQPRREPRSAIDLAQLSPNRALIVVDPRVIQSMPGVSVVPMAPGRAFLAFDDGRGLADLEVGIQDQLRNGKTNPAVRKELTILHRRVRDWRRSRRLRYSTRSIILVEGAKPARRGQGPRARPVMNRSRKRGFQGTEQVV
jgi:hypothetical protein